MVQTIGWLIAFGIVYGIPYLRDKKNEKIEAEKKCRKIYEETFWRRL